MAIMVLFVGSFVTELTIQGPRTADTPRNALTPAAHIAFLLEEFQKYGIISLEAIYKEGKIYGQNLYH